MCISLIASQLEQLIKQMNTLMNVWLAHHCSLHMICMYVCMPMSPKCAFAVSLGADIGSMLALDYVQ